jgi:hypothetical protein
VSDAIGRWFNSFCWKIWRFLDEMAQAMLGVAAITLVAMLPALGVEQLYRAIGFQRTLTTFALLTALTLVAYWLKRAEFCRYCKEDAGTDQCPSYCPL